LSCGFIYATTDWVSGLGGHGEFYLLLMASIWARWIINRVEALSWLKKVMAEKQEPLANSALRSVAHGSKILQAGVQSLISDQ
jgi:hypothetical protein